MNDRLRTLIDKINRRMKKRGNHPKAIVLGKWTYKALGLEFKENQEPNILGIPIYIEPDIDIKEELIFSNPIKATVLVP